MFLLLKSFLPLFCDKDCIGDVLKAILLELLSEYNRNMANANQQLI